MQIAVIEYTRNVCGIVGAGSEELDGASATSKIIVNIPESDQVSLGGTMRLGLRPTYFQRDTEWSRVCQLYRSDMSQKQPFARVHSIAGNSGRTSHNALSASADTDMPAILECRRHRFEVNPKYVEQPSKAGFSFVGQDGTGGRMEVLELREHPYFVGIQFYPEYLSRVLGPNKPCLGLVTASIGRLEEGMGHGLWNGAAANNGNTNGFYDVRQP